MVVWWYLELRRYGGTLASMVRWCGDGAVPVVVGGGLAVSRDNCSGKVPRNESQPKNTELR